MARVVILALLVQLAHGQVSPVPTSNFVNWENPHVHPIEMTPDGRRLLAVNTADNSIWIGDLDSPRPTPMGSVSVGLDPVSVRCVDSTTAWVVNHVSDSISVIDLPTMRVVRTIDTEDEPCDVVFAGTPRRAFVSCSQMNLVQVFDIANPTTPLATVPIRGEDPRSMDVSPDGSKVYVAVFESGNGSTILGGGSAGSNRLAFPPNVVSDATGPYGGVNPPPNNGPVIFPALTPGLPAAPAVGLIVKKDAQGRWMDDNNGNWTNLVSGANASRSGRRTGWDLPDRDLAVIDANTLSISYATRLMNMCMAVGVNPSTGAISVVGTDAINEVRFEPNVNGRFVRVNIATVQASNLANKSIRDLNPHLTYTSSTVPQSVRDQSIGDPRAIEWNASGTTGFVSGMGSNNVIAVDAGGLRLSAAPITVGEGPTGIAVDDSRGRLYVLNRFDGTISVVTLSSWSQAATIQLFDPTPTAIKLGREYLYNTHQTSGLGQVSCASCHVDARIDRLAWDLGDPSSVMQSLGASNLGANLPGLNNGFQPFHPMKGPMTTQTFQDIIGKEPHHWRGDRAGIEAFNPAFVGLLGDDVQLAANEMQDFENFLATITYPPNPYRNLDNTLKTSLPLPEHYTTGRFAAAGQPLPNGNAVNGLAIYRNGTRRLDSGALACVTCHTLPTGAGTDYRWNGSVFQPITPGPLGERHLLLVSIDGSTNVSMKVAQLRNMHEKTGFNTTQLDNTAGFGFLHDGSVDSIERFIAEPVFGVQSDQEIADLTALMLSFAGSDLPAGSTTNILEPPGPPSKDSHAAVGTQTTLVSEASASPTQLTLLNTMITLANTNKVGLVAKGKVGGIPRGYAYTGANTFAQDRAGLTITFAALKALAAPGSEITFTIVPKNSEIRIGIDRNMDGCRDGDERLALCGLSAPCPADLNGDGSVDGDDVIAFFDGWDANALDFDLNGSTDGDDVIAFFGFWDSGC